MGAKSEIEWTDATWNPVRGCSMAKGSETGGCLNCYAARMASRNLPELKSPTTGKPFARILQCGPRWTGDVELIDKALGLPLKWKKPKRIFVNSMSDLFHESLSNEDILRVFAEMARAYWHTFQVLTKRADRLLVFLEWLKQKVHSEQTGLAYFPGVHGAVAWPLPNAWVGVSVENQATADARIPLLLQTPAAIRFVSYEPALGPVDFDAISITVAPGFFGSPLQWHHRGRCHQADMENVPYPKLDWVIVGGESGPGARPFDIAWARNAIQQCKAAGVPVFCKQLGAVPMMDENQWRARIDAEGNARLLNPLNAARIPSEFVPLAMNDRKGGDWLEWPEDLRVREFPVVSL